MESRGTDDISLDFFSSPARGSAVVERMELFIQDNGIVSCDPARKKEILEAEQFIKSLPELTYYVTKINQWGKHQSRQLRLTSDGIQNIRNLVTSSTYRYSEVVTVSMRNINTFVLQYQNAPHDYVYRSPVAMQIVQEISTRIAIRRTTDKKKLTYDIALEYQKKLKEEGQHSDSTTHRDENFIGEEPESHTSSPTTSTSYSSFSSLSSSDGDNVKRDSADGETRREGGGLHRKRATKLMKILGTTEQQRLQNEVDRLLLSANMPEGRTVNQFVSDFHVLMKSPATVPLNVRRFIDSLKTHIMEKRGAMLSKLLVNTEENPQAEPVNLNTVVELCLEKSVIVRLQKPIFASIQTQARSVDEQLAACAGQLRYKPQSFYGIPEALRSSNNWSTALLELSCINRCETPADKNGTILAAAKAIYNAAYHELRGTKKDYYLSADDFLPIYIFIVVNSGITDLESTNQFLWLLSDPIQLSGESGYYLTVFSSVVNLLKALDLTKLATAHTIDELITNDRKNDSDDDDVSPPRPVSRRLTLTSSGGGSSNNSNSPGSANLALRCVRKLNRGVMAVKATLDFHTRKQILPPKN